jgi:hypothetical protein
VLYVNQEMVVRLGAVTGVGHARLILERFGRFWGAFSVIDLFILNALTIITEFIGITLAAGYLGLPRVPSVVLAATVVVAAAFTGSFRRFERIAVAFCAGSLCNDVEVLGPWVNGRKTNLFVAAVVAVLVALSVILTASVLFPAINARQIVDIMIACGAAGVVAGGYGLARRLRSGAPAAAPVDRSGRENWRMPPLAMLHRPVMSAGRRIGMGALRLYLGVAMILVIVRIAELALGH